MLRKNILYSIMIVPELLYEYKIHHNSDNIFALNVQCIIFAFTFPINNNQRFISLIYHHYICYIGKFCINKMTSAPHISVGDSRFAASS